MRLLFLTPQFPYPPHKGTTLRNYNVIAGLAQRHTIDLLSFTNEAAATPSTPLDQLCCRITTVKQPARATSRRMLDTLLSPWPDMGLRLWSPEFRQHLTAWLRDGAYDVIQVEGLELARYMLTSTPTLPRSTDRGGRRPAIVFDDHNAEYLLQKRIAQAEIAARGWNAGAVYSSIQWRKLRRFERQVCQHADRVVCVSQADAMAVQQLDPTLRPYVVPNGVDTEFYRREAITPLELPPHSLVFTGTMDFRPNVDAMIWFAQEVLPLIKRDVSDVHLYIVGQRPHARLDALRADPAITITGAVEDTRPYTSAADVYVVPLRMGGGTRLKLLEALALETPIVSTTLGAEGFEVTHDRELLFADDAASFARAIEELLAHRDRARALGVAGRAFAVEHYDWRRIVPKFEEVYRTLEA